MGALSGSFPQGGLTSITPSISRTWTRRPEIERDVEDGSERGDGAAPGMDQERPPLMRDMELRRAMLKPERPFGTGQACRDGGGALKLDQ